MAASIISIVKVVNELNKDVDRCSPPSFDKNLSEEERQFWRRSLVRALFSFIEGVTYTIKQVAYDDGQTNNYSFTQAEMAMISEESYDINDKGEPIIQAAKISNLHFTSMGRCMVQIIK
jgi:hypothetical protein